MNNVSSVLSNRTERKCPDRDIPEKMLRRMLGTSGDGHHDHLMDFTQAVSGAHAPSLALLSQC